MSKKAKPQYERELSPEVIAVLREVAPDYLEDYEELDEDSKKWLREGNVQEIRELLTYSRDLWGRIERGEDIPVPHWNPDPDSPMMTRLWEIAKAAEADPRSPEEIQADCDEFNRWAAEQGQLLTEEDWEGVGAAWLFFPDGGPEEPEGEEEGDEDGEKKA